MLLERREEELIGRWELKLVHLFGCHPPQLFTPDWSDLPAPNRAQKKMQLYRLLWIIMPDHTESDWCRDFHTQLLAELPPEAVFQ